MAYFYSFWSFNAVKLTSGSVLASFFLLNCIQINEPLQRIQGEVWLSLKKHLIFILIY